MTQLKQNRPVIDGVILAGGQSRRMGQDKAQLSVNGVTLLDYHIAAMQPYVNQLFIAANNNVSSVKQGNSILIQDALVGSQGPLSGLLSALKLSDADYLWIMSCDNYGFDKALMDTLISTLQQGNADIACLSVFSRQQPLISVMRVDLHQSLADYLDAGHRAVMRWYKSLHVVDVQWDKPGFWSNLNTEDDFKALLASLV